MNLADRIVAHVGGHCGSHLYIIAGEGWQAKLSASDFERDWRVAGALMEKMTCVGISELCQKSDGLRYHGWLKDPHAIILACVEWLER